MRNAASFALVLAIAVSVASGALAQDSKKQRAARFFDKGVASLDDHSYKIALESFKTAYELMPHWRVLAHIGTCYAKLNQPVKSINALERYLEEGDTDVTADERKAAMLMLQEQRNKVGSLRLLTSLPEAEAKIDGESVGRAPFGRILLLSGPHHVILFNGKDIYEADVDVVVGMQTTLQLPPTEGAPEPVTAPVPAEGPTPPALAAPQPITVEVGASQLPKEPEPTTRKPRHSGTSVAFALSLVATGLGIGAAVPGWIAFGYHSSSESSFAKQTKILEVSDGYAYDVTCPVENGNFVVNNQMESYYCKTEWKRRWYEDKASKSLIPAIIGTSVVGVGTVLSIMFYLNAQWFDHNDGGASHLMLAPVVTGETTGLALTGTF